MYRLMGLFPGTRFDSAVAAATAAVPRAEAKRVLGALADANLLDDAAGGQYRFHDLTRLHAREMADRDEPERPGKRRSAACSTGSWPGRELRPSPSRPTGPGPRPRHPLPAGRAAAVRRPERRAWLARP